MNNIDLRKLQTLILMVAKEVKRICDKNDIKYSMLGGTLIGAVRHNGFIPWDDDLDFVMTRDNYDKFVSCCKTQLRQEYLLINWNTDPHYDNAFLKIMLKDTLAVETGKENAKCAQCIFVDIFPFDKIPNNSILRTKQKWITYTCIKLLQQQENRIKYSGVKRIAFTLLGFVSTIVSRKLITRLCEHEMKKYRDKDVKCYTSIAGFYGYSKEISSSTLFDSYIQLPFEDTTFMAIEEYDIYLKQVFGNYMQLPPLEKRRSHGLVKYDFGKFN